MKKIDLEKIHEILTEQLKIYITSIIEIYGKYIPYERLFYLKNITNYKKIIRIYDYGSINGFANSYNNTISMPLSADKVLKNIKKLPGVGINKKHKTYDQKNLIINDNTFFDYIKHVFISGTDTLGYYEDLLLHEVMHFCGSGGASALKEGINELLTRKIAKEKNFRTNACGYPKEVKIAYELQNIFGNEVINQIAFLNTEYEVISYLDKKLGHDSALLYEKVSRMMEEEFDKKYYSFMDEYDGIIGILKKTNNYKKIDYGEIYKLINSYKSDNDLVNGVKKEEKSCDNYQKSDKLRSSYNVDNQYYDVEIQYKKHR